MPHVKLLYFSKRWILAASARVKKSDTRTFWGAPRRPETGRIEKFDL
jgi:hypothetical protein